MKSRWQPLLVYVLVSSLCTGLLFAIYPAIDPATGWNDHFFYWGQANAWFGLNQPLLLTPEVQTLLDTYRVDYYYDIANGDSQQPPYVYRIGVPIVAGLLGTVMSLGAAFLTISIASFVILGVSSAVAVRRLSGSRQLALVAIPIAICAPGFSSFTRFYAMVDMPSIALVSLTLALVISGRFYPALVIASILAPLVKETSIALAFFVAAFRWLQGDRGWIKWLFALLPIPLIIALRLLTPVPSPPAMSELFVAASPFESINTFVAAFGFALPLIVGMLAPAVRPLFVSSLPVIMTLIVVTSSVVATGQRIWLTMWPFVVVLGLRGLQSMANSIRQLITLVAVALLGIGLANIVELGFVDRVLMTVWLLLVVGTLGLISAINLHRRVLRRQKESREALDFEQEL